MPLSDLEVVTGHQTKGIIPEIFQGGEGGKAAKEAIVQICKTWQQAYFDEADLRRIKSMNLQEIVQKRKLAEQAVTGSDALKCPQFLKHVSATSN